MSWFRWSKATLNSGAAVLAVVGLGSIQPAAADPPSFEFIEVGSGSGIESYQMAEGLGGGLAAADFDADGFIDVFVPNGVGVPDQLYHNMGDGQFVEIAQQAGVASLDQSRVALWLDYDADADLDLLVANDLESSPTTYRLYRQNAPAIFEDVTGAAGLFVPMTPPAQDTDRNRGGLCATDINQDGYLDIISAQWNGSHHLFLNNGNGSFADISATSGINAAFYYGDQPMSADFNGDGWMDIYMAIDFLWNSLFINNHDLTFSDVAPAAGADNAMNDMGMALGDFDNDADLDIYVTNITAPAQHNILLRNDRTAGDPVFTEVAQSQGVEVGGWGWGATFLDADNDGWLDIAATNGWFTPMFEFDQSRFYRNESGQGFSEVSTEVHFDDSLWGSGLVAFDYDRDGDVDLMQTTKGGPLRLLANQHVGPDKPNRYLVVKPRMAGANRFAIGAIVRLVVDGGQQMRLITAGTSYLSQEPAEAVFGIGQALSVDTVRVEWPDGSNTCLHNIAANQTLVVEQQAVAPACDCPSDLDGNGQTGPQDLAALLSDWGPCQACPPDLNADQIISSIDLVMLLLNWGPCP